MLYGLQSSDLQTLGTVFFIFQFIYGLRFSALDLGGCAVLDFCHYNGYDDMSALLYTVDNGD